MIDAKEDFTVTMPLYRWLMLIGALAMLPDASWWETLADQVLEAAMRP